jgi:hypothetical protein
MFNDENRRKNLRKRRDRFISTTKKENGNIRLVRVKVLIRHYLV